MTSIEKTMNNNKQEKAWKKASERISPVLVSKWTLNGGKPVRRAEMSRRSLHSSRWCFIDFHWVCRNRFRLPAKEK